MRKELEWMRSLQNEINDLQALKGDGSRGARRGERRVAAA